MVDESQGAPLAAEGAGTDAAEVDCLVERAAVELGQRAAAPAFPVAPDCLGDLPSGLFRILGELDGMDLPGKAEQPLGT